MLGTKIAGAVFIFPARAVLNIFYPRPQNYRYGISENPSLRATFSALRNSFCNNTKVKNAGSTQRWLGKCGSSIYFRQRRFLNTFSFSHIFDYLKTEPASGNPTEGLPFTYILWELYFRLYRIAGQAKTVCPDSSAHYKYYTALHRYYSF